MVRRARRRYAHGGIFLLLTFLLLPPALAQHPNVLVRDYFPERDNYPNEPSIVINPLNTNEMMATTNGPKQSYYYSTDGGASWQQGGQYSFATGLWGDPCVITDRSGNYYFLHLERNWTSVSFDRIYCRKLTHLGDDWSKVSSLAYNPPRMQDKEWAAFDPSTNNIYVVWTEFDSYGSSNPDHFSNIMFSLSTDGGGSWSAPQRINEVSGDCLDRENTVHQAVPAVGPDGEIYVCWSGPAGIVVDVSADQGKTWLDHDIFVSEIPGGRPFPVLGFYRGGCLPMIACDASQGPHSGTVYLQWPDQRNGPDDTDIWLSRSTDHGMTWSDPLRVNDDPPGKQQLFPWLAVDQTTGYLYSVFYDRRNYDDTRTDVYLAVSLDGGTSFSNHRISESPFVPLEVVFMGDYSTVAAHDNVVRPIWARMDNRKVSVWTALVNTEILVDVSEEPPGEGPRDFELTSAYPNPFNASTSIQYQIPRAGDVSVRIFSVTGKEVALLFSGRQEPGMHRIVWDAGDIASGEYFVRLEYENRTRTLPVVLLR